ncbi:MAG: RNA polymerase sigma-70 factor, partial [Tannerella sp.]|nr:RNA polymerase sigma-70 factor [Tannerella sp.]
NISINTIETQMGIAYKKLKAKLKNYLPLMFFIL